MDFQIGDLVTLVSWEPDWDGIKWPGVIVSIKPANQFDKTQYEIYWFDQETSEELEQHIVKI